MMALKDELDDRHKQLPNRATESCDSLVMSSCVRVSQYASAVGLAKIVYFADEPFCLSPLQLYARNNYLFDDLRFLEDAFVQPSAAR